MSILFPFFKTGFKDPHVKGKARKLSKENEGNIFMTPEGFLTQNWNKKNEEENEQISHADSFTHQKML